MSSDDEDAALLRDELQELQELLGVSYRSVASQEVQPATRDPLSGAQAARHAALAKEWADINTLHEADARACHESDGPADPDEGGNTAKGGRAAVIAAALAKNRELQKRLRAGLASLNRASHKLADLRAQVDAVKQKYKGTKPGTVQTQASGASRFWSAAGRTPEPNADTRRLLPAYQYLPPAFGSSAWPAAETGALQQAVLTVAQEVMLNRQLDRPNASQADLAAIAPQLKELQWDSPEVRDVAAELSAEQWAKVAALAGGRRGGPDCRCHWAAELAANRDPWTADEHARMMDIAAKHSFSNWPAIAQELGTGRHPSECLARRQRGLGAAPAAKWDAAEDARLQAAVTRHGRNWQAIASEVGGARTAANCLQRWSRRGLGTSLKKGQWDREEDRALLQAVAVEGLKWSLVAKHVPSRSDVQCRERYMNVLDPSLKPDPWDLEEEQQLAATVERNRAPDGSISWVGVAAGMPGRTDNQVARHWRTQEKGSQRRRSQNGGGRKGAAKPTARRKGKQSAKSKASAKSAKRKLVDSSDGGSSSSDEDADVPIAKMAAATRTSTRASARASARVAAQAKRKTLSDSSSDGDAGAGSNQHTPSKRARRRVVASSSDDDA